MMKKTREEILTNTFVVSAVAFICCVLWGSAFPTIKIGYQLFKIQSADTASQILFAGTRFTIAGILSILIFSCTGRKMLIPKKESYTKIVKLCMFQTVGQYFFFYVGLAHTSGVKASIIEAVNVFCVIVVSCMILRTEKLSAEKCIGSVIGFSGVVLVNIAGATGDMAFNLVGDGSIFMSAVMYAMSSVFMKRYSKEENPVVLSGYQFIVGGLIMVAGGLIAGGKLTTVNPKGLMILIYLSLVSAVAYSLWSMLLKYNDASRVAIFGFVNPVFGVILSAILLGESDNINIYCVISLILVCFGIYLANKESKL